MKDVLTDANFPRTADGRVYHLGTKPGEISNRIITVGPPSRARSLAGLLSAHPPPFVLQSERGFLTITGRYDDDAGGASIPVTIVAIGMGAPNLDFFVREARECVSGDMLIVRLGSCGGLLDSLPVGSVVVPQASVAITRNYDFDFTSHNNTHDDIPYRISKPVQADPDLHDAILHALNASQPPEHRQTQVRGDVVNASADSFYSSQGRQTSFPDHNATLIERLMSSVDGVASLEMETFHLFHLAASWHNNNSGTHYASASAGSPAAAADPPRSDIRAASAHMIFAARKSREFITPDHVREVEAWSGRAVLDALVKMHIQPERLHPDEGSVWEVK